MSLGGGSMKSLPRGDPVLVTVPPNFFVVHGRLNGLVCVYVSKTPLPLVPAAD